MGDTMKKSFALVLMVASLPAWAAPPANFEARVEAVRTAAEVPGMAIAIVENGAVTLARGFGVRKLGSPENVDADTIFMTGSTGKAFTAAALATLVDAGKLKWDDRVTDHIPGFQMYDPWVTREMTVRDLLVHRSGLGLGRGRPAVRAARHPVARRSRQAPALHQAGDQLPQRLCLRQHPLHRRRPRDRAGERPAV